MSYAFIKKKQQKQRQQNDTFIIYFNLRNFVEAERAHIHTQKKNAKQTIIIKYAKHFSKTYQTSIYQATMRCYASYGYYNNTREYWATRRKKLNKLVHPSNSIAKCIVHRVVQLQQQQSNMMKKIPFERKKKSHFSINYILIDVPFRWLSMHSISCSCCCCFFYYLSSVSRQQLLCFVQHHILSQRPSVRSLCYFCSDYLTFFINSQQSYYTDACLSVINGLMWWWLKYKSLPSQVK